MVKIDKVSYSFGKRFSLKDVSLHIEEGSITVLLGPNGSGKSTLLNLVSGIMTPQKGEIRLGSEQISKMKPRNRAKSIAVVRQFISAPFDYTVFDIVSMGRYAYKKRFEVLNNDDIDIIRKYLCEMGIEHLEDEMVSKISGGELQRVSLARALCQQSDLLLLDEPINHLDIRHQCDILNIVKKRADKGETTLCVLHDINIALQYADKVVLMKDGSVANICAPDKITKAQLSTLYNVDEERLQTMIFDRRK